MIHSKQFGLSGNPAWVFPQLLGMKYKINFKGLVYFENNVFRVKNASIDGVKINDFTVEYKNGDIFPDDTFLQALSGVMLQKEF